MSDDAPGFLARWSRRKVAVRQAGVAVEAMPAVAMPPSTIATSLPIIATPQGTAPADNVAPSERLPAPGASPQGEPVPDLPTLAEVAQLTPASDFRRFVAPGVDAGVRNAALKTLFRDPHFNVMDGLDTYIDDYGRPDPLPVGMLRQMAQSKFLGLFSDDEPAPAENAPPDEDTDLRLQPHAEAGPDGVAPGAGEDAGREH